MSSRAPNRRVARGLRRDMTQHRDMGRVAPSLDVPAGMLVRLGRYSSEHAETTARRLVAVVWGRS